MIRSEGAACFDVASMQDTAEEEEGEDQEEMVMSDVKECRYKIKDNEME
jgi:hypothetical protein